MKKFNSNSLGRIVGGEGIVVGMAVFYLAKPLSALCCMKKFNRNSLGGGIVVGMGSFLFGKASVSFMLCEEI